MIGVCVESQIGQVFMADLGGEIVHGRTHGVSYRVAQEAGQTGRPEIDGTIFLCM